MVLLGKQRYITSGLILVSAVSFAGFVFVYSPDRLHTEFDDSYMYCRYASNFLSGHGFSWNSQDGPSHGATSPAYLVLITLLKHFSSAGNSLLLSTASFWAGLAGLFLLVYAGYLRGGLKGIPLLTIPLILISSSFRFHSFTGMETTLSFASNALLVLSVLLYGKKPCAKTFIAVFLCSVLTFTVRPDNGVYALLFPPLFLLTSGRISMKRALLLAVLFTAAVGILLIIYTGLFGSALPVPFYSKSGGYFQGYAGAANWNAVGYILTFLRDTAPFTAIVVLLASRKKTIELLSVLVPLVITFIYFSSTVQIMGWFARYYFPSIPFVVLSAWIVLKEAMSNRILLTAGYLAKRVAVLLLVFLPVFCTPVRTGVTGILGKANSRTTLFTPDTEFRTLSGRLPESVPWWDSISYMASLVGELPDGVTVAATEHGYLASENMHAVIIDMAGLHDIEFARSGFSSERILSREPDLVWLPHLDYTWFRKALLDDPVFHDDYDYYPGVMNYGIALRRESPLHDEMLTALEAVFRRAYPGETLGDFQGIQIVNI